MATPFVRYGQDGLSAYDAAGVRRIWLDPLNLLLSFFDATGLPRCEIGNLQARGVSPAGWGFRVNDATGAPIYDSQGVIQHTTLVGSASSNDTSVNLSTASKLTFVALTGVTTTFHLARQSTVEIAFTSQGRAATSGAGFYAYAAVHLDGVVQNGPLDTWGLWDKGNVGFTSTTGLLVKTLAAGDHTIDIRISTADNTVTWWQYQTQLNVFLLGG